MLFTRGNCLSLRSFSFSSFSICILSSSSFLYYRSSSSSASLSYCTTTGALRGRLFTEFGLLIGGSSDGADISFLLDEKLLSYWSRSLDLVRSRALSCSSSSFYWYSALIYLISSRPSCHFLLLTMSSIFLWFAFIACHSSLSWNRFCMIAPFWR